MIMKKIIFILICIFLTSCNMQIYKSVATCNNMDDKNKIVNYADNYDIAHKKIIKHN